MDKNCVFFITDYWYPKIGGLENSIHYLLRPLSQHYNIELLTHSDNYSEEFHDNIKVIRFERDEKTYYHSVFEYLKTKKRPFVCHLFGFSFQWPKEQSELVEKIKKELKCPVIFKIPTSNDATQYINEFYSDKKEHIDFYITLNKHIENELSKDQISKDRIFSVSNSVPTDLFLPATEEEKMLAKEKLGIPISKFILGFLGRFIKRKNIDLLISAVNSIEPKNRPCLLLVGYSDPAFNSGFDINVFLSEDIKHIPVTENTREIYHALDAYITASDAEGMSNSVLEAMSFGLPVLANRIPGHSEMVKHEVNGLLFSNENPDEIAASIRHIMDLHKTGKAQIFSDNSRNSAIKNYDSFTIAEKYYGLYEKLFDKYGRN